VETGARRVRNDAYFPLPKGALRFLMGLKAMTFQTLRLEYACTKKEMEEAQSLNLRKQVGRGSKWLTWLVLLLLAGGLGALLWFRVRHEISGRYQPYFWLAVLAVWLFFVYQQKRSTGRSKLQNRVEVTPSELKLDLGGTKLTLPWSSFSDCLESPNLFVLVDRPKSFLVVLPKRAFPSESWQTWFRERAGTIRNERALELGESAWENIERGPNPGASVTDEGGKGQVIAVRFRLGFGDYVDRTLASWFSLGLILAFSAMPIVVGLFVLSKPDPKAVYTDAQMFLYFIIPASMFSFVFYTLIAAAMQWGSHKAHLVRQEISFSPETVRQVSKDGTVEMPWSNFFMFYKETRRSFVLWKRDDSSWVMIPKRSFTSKEELSKCRLLFAQHLHPSRAFFG
jgi:hypothetical protein